MASTPGPGEKVRHRIQDAIDKAEAEKKLLQFRQRVDIARQGVKCYQGKKLPEAVRAFHRYLAILEDHVSVGEGGLLPSQFDMKTDLPELLLISGIYWDLAKMYDRTKSPERRKDFLHYLEKYVLFSKNMPFQPLSAETMRKYIAVEKPIHREDFRRAYKLIAINNCFVVTALVDEVDVETIPALRTFRDRVLARCCLGRIFIATYYFVGPPIAVVVEALPSSIRKRLGRGVSALSRRLTTRFL